MIEIILIGLFILFVIVVVVVVIGTSSSSGVKYVPYVKKNSYYPIDISTPPPGFSLSPIGIHLPLRNIENLDAVEQRLVSGNTTLTQEQTLEEFAPDNETYEKCISFLNAHGTVMWVSSTKTCLIYQPSTSFYTTLCNGVWSLTDQEQYYVNSGGESIFYTLPLFNVNNDVSLPYGMTSMPFNCVGDTSARYLKSAQWSDTLEIANNGIITPIQTNVNMQKVDENPVGSIILYESEQILTIQTLIYFAQYYNTKYGTSYSDTYFADKVILTYLDENLTNHLLSLPPSALPPAEAFDYDRNNNGEMLLDVLACFETNPNINIYIFYGMIYSGVSDDAFVLNPINQNSMVYDFNVMYQYLVERDGINCVSNSYALNFLKVSPNDYQRLSLSSRLLGAQGLSIFNSSGDTGPWSITNNSNLTDSDLYDLTKPDLSYPIVNGNGVITVGGYNPNQNFAGYNPYATMAFPGNPNFSSAGGFQRGYSLPLWKKVASNSYKLKKSISNQITKNSFNFKSVDIEVEENGNITPDLVFNGVTNLLDNPTYGVYGTSLASPYLAARVATINSLRSAPLVSLYKIIYSPQFRECLIRKITQPNFYAFFNGYSPDVSDGVLWDPVNGLGIPDYEKMKDVLLNTSNIVI